MPCSCKSYLHHVGSTWQAAVPGLSRVQQCLQQVGWLECVSGAHPESSARAKAHAPVQRDVTLLLRVLADCALVRFKLKHAMLRLLPVSHHTSYRAFESAARQAHSSSWQWQAAAQQLERCHTPAPPRKPHSWPQLCAPRRRARPSHGYQGTSCRCRRNTASEQLSSGRCCRADQQRIRSDRATASSAGAATPRCSRHTAAALHERASLHRVPGCSRS